MFTAKDDLFKRLGTQAAFQDRRFDNLNKFHSRISEACRFYRILWPKLPPNSYLLADFVALDICCHHDPNGFFSFPIQWPNSFLFSYHRFKLLDFTIVTAITVFNLLKRMPLKLGKKRRYMDSFARNVLYVRMLSGEICAERDRLAGNYLATWPLSAKNKDTIWNCVCWVRRSHGTR